MIPKYMPVLGLLAVVLTNAPALADETQELMKLAMSEQVEPWMAEPAVLEAIRAQNAANAALTPADITAMDDKWKAEAETGAGPTIDPVLTNSVSVLLRQKVAASNGVVTELIIMDNRGLNVAASSATSDYWQGDEAKYIETFPLGAGAISMSEVELDQSTGVFQGQISMTIVDPATGEAIGAVTAGIISDELM